MGQWKWLAAPYPEPGVALQRPKREKVYAAKSGTTGKHIHKADAIFHPRKF